jgi:hypothetical protein
MDRDEQRRRLQECFDAIEEKGLEPEWHEDGLGFDWDCPACEDEEAHRRSTRVDPHVLSIVATPWGIGSLVVDQAHGPAV